MPKLESPKRGKTATAKKEPATAGVGWKAVAARKDTASSFSDSDILWDFRVKDGESAIVQFLDDEPYCYDAHSVKNSKGHWMTLACQLATQGHCLMCEDGSKQVWKAAFKVLDFRGAWDKDKKDFSHGDPVEKIWRCSNTVALQIESLIKKRGVPLTQQVLEVSRTGSGAKDTSYNFQRAFDEETESLMKPIDHKSKTAPTWELCQPLADIALEKMGVSSSDD